MASEVSARTRIAVAVVAGAAAAGVATALTPWQVAALTGWDVTAAVFLVWVWSSIWGLDGEQTADVATRVDDSRSAADLILIAACVASLTGVGFALLKASDTRGTARGLIAGVAVVSVVLSWASVHTVFTLRYARIFHVEGGGIDFTEPGHVPDYRDFAYVAFTIGMTFQVSDTDLTSFSMRRTALRHALLAYLFGIVIVAITINMVAGLFS
jgi:uncharacterized membrane protein